MAKKNKEKEFVNRKARFEYEFLESVEAGIKLTGTEIKSIRAGHVNLRDGYCVFERGEMLLRSLYIGEYKEGNQFNHEERRPRKLLLKKQELRKWEKKVKEKGFTIVPYRLYINERGLAKVEVVLVQGKKVYDKRDTIRQRENKRQMERVKKQYL
ncbi:SsrA-binding protein [Lewinella marina]|uniref:SsrA-binding protein n=1 Tax=Neolewinella marina TaxID=438751 RepID=A0A2G0CDY6_9BACT|nr:SsrA-binding protein SmpB [Neolewinella marina]NJB87512.1 SsrA-binding protein [Neolewinella marina]PHK98182.1 SsrA-binding protein [Neolewinella marina]